MENLWRDYQFLTREMAIFIARQELDMFYELQSQRLQLQAMIEEQGDRAYLQTEAGREMVREVQAADALMATQLRGNMNRLTQQRQVRHAYHPAYSPSQSRRADFSG